MSLESYFIGKEKCLDEFRNDVIIQKRIGRLASFATQQYKTQENVKIVNAGVSAAILELARKFVNDYDAINNISSKKIKKVKTDLNFDMNKFKSDLKLMTDDSSKMYILKSDISSIDRCYLTIEAVKMNLVVYEEVKHTDSKDDKFLVISNTKNETIDEKHLPKKAKELFCRIMSLDNDFNFDQIEVCGLSSKFALFLENIIKFGVDGYDRYNIVLDRVVTEHITNLPEFKTLKMSGSRDIPKEISPAFTVVTHTYGLNDKVCISLDLKSAIFEAYRAFGIIKQATWTDFMKCFTNDQLLIDSKKFRLGVFGKLDKSFSKTDSFVSNSVMLVQTAYQTWTKSYDVKSGDKDTVVDIAKRHDASYIMEGDEMVILPIHKIPLADYQDILSKILDMSLPKYIAVSCYTIYSKKCNLNVFPDGIAKPVTIKKYIYPSDKPMEFKNISKSITGDIRAQIIAEMNACF